MREVLHLRQLSPLDCPPPTFPSDPVFTDEDPRTINLGSQGNGHVPLAIHSSSVAPSRDRITLILGSESNCPAPRNSASMAVSPAKFPIGPRQLASADNTCRITSESPRRARFTPCSRAWSNERGVSTSSLSLSLSAEITAN